MWLTQKAYCEPNNIMEKVVTLTNESPLNPVGDTSNLSAPLKEITESPQHRSALRPIYEAVKYIIYLLLIGEQVPLLWFTVHVSIFKRCKNVCTIPCTICRESLSKSYVSAVNSLYQLWMKMCTWSCFYQLCCQVRAVRESSYGNDCCSVTLC